MEAKQVLEVRKLEEQLAAARESARAAFLNNANDAISQLKAIGYEYELKEVGAATAKRGRPRKEDDGEVNGTEKHPVEP